MAERTEKSNRLIHEKSPYLLQHAHNPVDWYPWGKEAFKKAREENKPILVSIGYSTCHWCHVMEKESFENPQVAAVMNKYLISIKVDREERPDIDKIYMSAVNTMTGQGGWPLNVFLTPDLKPFFGGTYFPPEPRWGQPAWPDIIHSIGENWANPEARQKIVSSADNLTQSLRQYLASRKMSSLPDASDLKKAVENFRSIDDRRFGGFGGAPKFPMPVYHNFLLRYYAWTKNNPAEAEAGREALGMSVETLRAMARGGIYDHIGGGFHRYSTDERWHIPHFEKMLYDNAQLASVYLDAYQITHEPEFLKICKETLDYVLRDLGSPEGGFTSAEDADSEGMEGAFYVWKKQEIIDVLGRDVGEAFCQAYGVEPNGNAGSDPHGEFEHKNILFKAKTDPKLEKTLEEARQKLFQVRSRRPRPHLDDKIIASWNGLAITAFARAYQVLGEEKYLTAAERAARFIQEKMYDPAGRLLYRRWRDNEKKVAGTADDYAFLTQGLLDLYEASLDPQWMEWAVSLTETALLKFYDARNGGFYMTGEGHEDLIARVKEGTDNVEPSASSVATLNLLRLAVLTDRKDFREAAEKTLAAFGSQLKDHPLSMPAMLADLMFYLSKPTQIIIAGDAQAADTQTLLGAVRSRFLPHKILVLVDGDLRQARLARLQPFLNSLTRLQGRVTAYVCENFTCELPANDVRVLEKILDK